ncbi:GNAT family N-acetyltransferase [Streptomyces sp. H34-S4]|uniref:GNAT family N-acetyltransferase n=1 Tax=Streptomyces sp. H34-S4 TaxID=2996463 RepID=UPI0022706372|nr:GNAT family N-acetyltransferase [Streptomyces sp. H34-S4]MCY0935600.1 GNAT family N-acetyltransferase [Streptomyces sp. H34-S4]
MLHPRPGTSVVGWGAWRGGRPVGSCAVGVPDADRHGAADFVHFVVHPDARRAGVGKRLLDAAAGHVAGLGVRKLTGFTSAPVDRAGPGDASAEATGAVCAQRYQGLLLPLDPSGPSGPVTGKDAGPGPCSADAVRPRRGGPGR